MTNEIERPDLFRFPHFDGFMKKKDKYILDENNNVITADLMTWAIFLEEQRDRRIVKKDTIGELQVSTVFIGLDHKLSFIEERDDPDYKPDIFETMVFKDGSDIYCDRYATWKEAEEGHQKAIAWVEAGCIEVEDENE